MSNFKQGETVEASDYADFRDAIHVEFFWCGGGDYYAKHIRDDSELVAWKYVRAVPEIVPFTFDTFPRGAVYIRGKESNSRFDMMVLGISDARIGTADGSPNYKTLREDYEISTDMGETWLPCGEQS